MDDQVEGSGILLHSILFFGLLYGASAWLAANGSSCCSPKQKRFRAASSAISFVHSLTSASLALADLVSSSSSWELGAANTSFQARVMEWSLAYFLVDLCHYGLAVPEDHLFIAHHVSTTTYIASCRYYTHHGGTSVMSLLAAGEITTPLQAVWTLARLARDGGSQLADMIYVKLSPVYTLFFTAVRVVIGPLLLHELARYYLTLDHPAIPRWLACFWMLEVALAIAGSFVWVYKLWRGLLKMYSRRAPSRQE